ncbi:hypothetical protein GGE12_006268 [Rhizobium mongolense]|uniref:Uncharacterized protein n=1 Tax=Rhizobium mongolense TaxID=57676 RepID=A0A7W6RTP5_9HYPH|nr:hypothetical protein [Rhizobium mongolense]
MQALTFGRSKGLGFDRVVIYPTRDMVSWLKIRDVFQKLRLAPNFTSP